MSWIVAYVVCAIASAALFKRSGLSAKASFICGAAWFVSLPFWLGSMVMFDWFLSIFSGGDRK